MSDIANLTAALDTGAKFFRVIGGEGVTLEEFMRPVQDRTARRNLVQYLRAGCPKIGEVQSAPIETEKKPTLIPVTSTDLDAIPVKKTAECFRKSCWSYRDSDFDSWLPAEQLATKAQSISAHRFATQSTFIEMARAALKVDPDFPIEGLTILLFRHVLTLPQLEQLVDKQESGVDVGLRTDGYTNFAFVENSEGGVSVAGVDRDVAGWGGGVYRLDRDVRWDRVGRLLLSNSDAVTL